MTFDRAAIMTAAWVIARRFAGNRETWAQRLSRALRHAWWQAKEQARLAAAALGRDARLAAQPRRPTNVIRTAIQTLECKDTLRGADWVELDALRAELRSAA